MFKDKRKSLFSGPITLSGACRSVDSSFKSHVRRIFSANVYKGSLQCRSGDFRCLRVNIEWNSLGLECKVSWDDNCRSNDNLIYSRSVGSVERRTGKCILSYFSPARIRGRNSR